MEDDTVDNIVVAVVITLVIMVFYMDDSVAQRWCDTYDVCVGVENES